MSDASLPKTIKSVVLDTKTGKLSLDEVPTPQPPADEHLLRVHAAAITNGELEWGPFLAWPSHHVPTYDVAGTILTAVPGSKFRPGDEVYGRVDAMKFGASRDGTAREIATIHPSEAALKPKNLTWEEAATVPMSAETAWQGLFTQAGLKELDPGDDTAPPNEGKRVLVSAASGGVGSFAVQFAKLSGATVVGMCGPDNVEYVRSLGASEAVNYRTTSMREWVGGDDGKKFDVILFCTGGDSGKALEDAWGVLKEGGVIVSVVAGFKEPDAGPPKGAKGWFFIMESLGEQLERISKFIEQDKVKTAVDSVWKLEEFAQAFARTATGHAKGKVVLRI